MKRRVDYRGSMLAKKGGPSEHPQNKLEITDAGTGARSGADGGAQDAHPQNLIEGSRGEEAAESTSVETAELKAGSEIDSNSGPRAVGPPYEPIENKGGGGHEKPGARGGALTEQAQNLVPPSGAGTGADGKGHEGGGAQKRGGHAINTVLPAGKPKQPNPVGVDRDPRGRTSPPKGKVGSRKSTFGVRENLGHYLHKVGGSNK